jgi:hypothetical protein
MLRSEWPDLGPRVPLPSPLALVVGASAVERAGSPSNKLAAGCFPALAAPVRCLLPPAGRGGEERKMPTLVDVRSGGSGSGSSSAIVRVAERGHALASLLLFLLRPAVVAWGWGRGWGTGRPTPNFSSATSIPAPEVAVDFFLTWLAAEAGRWVRRVQRPPELVEGSESPGDSASYGTFSASASACRRNPWPYGWSRHARRRWRGRELLLPQHEDLL